MNLRESVDECIRTNDEVVSALEFEVEGLENQLKEIDLVAVRSDTAELEAINTELHAATERGIAALQRLKERQIRREAENNAQEGV